MGGEHVGYSGQRFEPGAIAPGLTAGAIASSTMHKACSESVLPEGSHNFAALGGVIVTASGITPLWAKTQSRLQQVRRKGWVLASTRAVE